MDVVNLSCSVFLAIIRAPSSFYALVMYYLVVPESFHLLIRCTMIKIIYLLQLHLVVLIIPLLCWITSFLVTSLLVQYVAVEWEVRA